MIGRIRGIILEKQAPELVIDVHGVGYELQAPLSTFYKLPAPGQEVVLYTHFVVREDAQQLYGFWQREDRSLFRTLIRVSGVGPKLALAILSGMDSEEFVRSVQRNDARALVNLPGVGKKTAERLIVEMRDRLDEWRPELSGGSVATPSSDIVATSRNRMVQDAESALIALGYKPQEAARAVSAALDDEVLESEELIRRALQGKARA
ncbi:MAG: Holliday junction branch migration protein RuvA [Gammaproteobacteria bacterium]|jgi:Holliday junction DNA helicase RuvA|nr:Holliday junction branch migration protein RuvA [Gammaproteobacteria bacterium]MBP6051662.1 Holliday junction branch migration protein RuvA [Pseudomonadales bacterium]MBK6584672.1 Holliday junction branch migration protein RuvA [Gammaproteobacteria bacterium]MBK7519819.1 Holliday junction branch migration protein RuvA [Gammaproteobacteria bacterium]MBK7730936.1 Holliday junction branch migration protein RuvA [Gammaproteobacteria bacterium]